MDSGGAGGRCDALVPGQGGPGGVREERFCALVVSFID